MKWLKYIPHPKYGNYGGLGHSGPDSPIDYLDLCFMLHDRDYRLGLKTRKQADEDLLKILETVEWFDVKHLVYGNFYCLMAKISFRIIVRLRR